MARGKATGCLVIVGILILGGMLSSLSKSCDGSTGSSKSQLAVASASKTPFFPTPQPSPTDIVTPLPSSTPTPAPVVVANTGGDGVYIRKTTSAGDKLKVWPDGTVMLVIGDDRESEGRKWKNVRDPDSNIGWVPAEFVAEPTATPAPTPRPTGVKAALDDMSALTKLFNEQAKQRFFINVAIKQDGNRLELTVSDYWFSMRSFEKERMIDTFGDAYALVAAQRGLRGPTANEANYPQTSFYDAYGKELGYKSTWETKVYR